MNLDDIKEIVTRLGIRRKSDGVLIVSHRGHVQDWLLDLREVLLRRDVLLGVAREFWNRYSNRDPFQVAGLATAAIPLLTAIILSAPEGRGNVNGFVIRQERKRTGRGSIVEGQVTTDPIILVDDVFNSGFSAERARLSAEQYGQPLKEIFAVVDFRSENGWAWGRAHGVGVNSLFVLSDFSLYKKSRTSKKTRQRYRMIWRQPVEGGNPYFVVPKSTPRLVGERLYRGCDAGKMNAFDTGTGSIIWEYATGASPRKGIWSSPAVQDDRVYFGAYNGTAYCLNAIDGKEIWAQPYAEWIGASPVVVPQHGLVYFGIEYTRPWAQGSVGALSINDGQKVWEYQVKKLQHGSPVYWRGGDLIIWGTADYEMTGFDAATGAIRWVFRTRRSVKYAPAVSEERSLVAFASYDKSIYVLDATTGELRGEWPTGDICYTTPLICGNRMFCGSGDRHLYVVDLDQMKLIKKIDLGSRVYSSPQRLGNRIIVGTNGGLVVEIDQEQLTVEGKLQLPDAVTNAVAVTPDGARIFVSTYMNHLYAFERL